MEQHGAKGGHGPGRNDQGLGESLSFKLGYSLLLLILLVLRLPDRIFHAQFYAEDGFFFEQALRFGWHTVVTPYGGYLLTLQRLITLTGTHISPVYVPLWFNALTLLVLFIVLFRLLSERVKLKYKPLLALLLVCYPHPEDLFLTMENTMWVLSLVLLILVFTDDAKTPLEILGDVACVLLSGLTGVFSVLFFPLFLLRAFFRKTKLSILTAGLVGFTAAIQCYFIVTAPKAQALDTTPVELSYIPAIIGYRFITHLIGGIKFLPLSVTTLSVAGAIMTCWILILLFIRGLETNERNKRLLLLGVMGITAAASLFRLKHSLPILISAEPLGRYFFLPQVAFMWLLAQELNYKGLRRRLAVIFFTLFFITTLSYFRLEPLKDMHWKEASQRVKRGAYYDILINPEGWHFRSENSGL